MYKNPLVQSDNIPTRLMFVSTAIPWPSDRSLQEPSEFPRCFSNPPEGGELPAGKEASARQAQVQQRILTGAAWSREEDTLLDVARQRRDLLPWATLSCSQIITVKQTRNH